MVPPTYWVSLFPSLTVQFVNHLIKYPQKAHPGCFANILGNSQTSHVDNQNYSRDSYNFPRDLDIWHFYRLSSRFCCLLLERVIHISVILFSMRSVHANTASSLCGLWFPEIATFPSTGTQWRVWQAAMPISALNHPLKTGVTGASPESNLLS